MNPNFEHCVYMDVSSIYVFFSVPQVATRGKSGAVEQVQHLNLTFDLDPEVGGGVQVQALNLT